MASPFPHTERCGRGGSGFTTPARDQPTNGHPLGSRLRQGSQPVEELPALPSWVENDLKMLVYYPMPRRLTMCAPDPRQPRQRAAGAGCAGAMVVGVAALWGRFLGSKLIPAKRRYLVPPTSTPQGHTPQKACGAGRQPLGPCKST